MLLKWVSSKFTTSKKTGSTNMMNNRCQISLLQTEFLNLKMILSTFNESEIKF